MSSEKTLSGVIDLGFKQAVDAAIAQSAKLKKALPRHVAQSPDLTRDMSVVRRVLDEAPDSFVMSLTMAQFWLNMSPDVWKARKKSHPDNYPFKGQPYKATKKQVVAWFSDFLHGRSDQKLKKDATTFGRCVFTGRPFLVRQSDKKILADANVTRLPRAEAEAALAAGGDLIILSLAEALARPWAHPEERDVWARGLIDALEMIMAAPRDD